MQVTFVPASMSFDTQSFFLKQPVAAAPIHCDPLTLRVPVRGAKSGRLLLLMLTVMSLTGKPSFAAEPLGRFFFTPAQRAQLDTARSQKSRVTLASEKEQDAAAPVAETLTLGGSVRRSDGKSTVWINNRAVNDGDASGGVVVDHRLQPNGSLTLQVPQSARSIELKVGQSVDIVSGTIEEPYARQVTSPKPEPAPKPASAAAGKPAPGEKAAATARTPEQKMLEAKPESALERLRPTRPEGNGNAPDRR